MAHHDLIIIGTGSGNSIADKSLRHLDIGIVEESTFGGTCSNVGCIPTKMLVYAAELVRSARRTARGSGSTRTSTRCAGPDIRDRIFGRTRPDVGVRPRLSRSTAPTRPFYGEHVEFVGPHGTALASGTELTADQIVIAAGVDRSSRRSTVSTTSRRAQASHVRHRDARRRSARVDGDRRAAA
jgi:mycothione reductase